MKDPIHVSSPPEARQPNKFANIFNSSIVIPVFIAIFVFILFVFILSKTPLYTMYFFFIGPFLNFYSLGNMINAAIPLILGALGVSVAMRAGSLNLGGEGQIYLGAFAATITALPLSHLGYFGSCIALLTGAFSAGLIAAFSGFLKARWNTNELITSFLLSNSVIMIVNYLVTNPFLDPQANLQSTRKIAENLRLPRILPPSNLSTALFFALALVVIVHIFLKKTKFGYELRMLGINEIFARYGGINTKMNTVLAMFVSGAFFGFAGGLMVFGSHYATIKEFSLGIGWNSLAAALIAGFYPAATVPAGFFFAWISSGSRIAMQNSDITYEVSYIIQSVIFFLSTSAILRNLFGKKRNLL